jgi:Tfp pilus assembly protein PilX
MVPPLTHRTTRPPARRRGAAMIVCLFIIFIVTTLVVSILDTETLELSAMRNAMDYERALALANAAVHHAAAELEAAPAWRGTVTDGSYPANDTYQGTAVSGSGNTVVVTGRGVAGSITRTITATIEL